MRVIRINKDNYNYSSDALKNEVKLVSHSGNYQFYTFVYNGFFGNLAPQNSLINISENFIKKTISRNRSFSFIIQFFLLIFRNTLINQLIIIKT